jgi:hypothetical protein
MVALAAAIAAEQHALETAIKTQTEKDFQLADEARQFRQRLWHAYLKEGETDKDGQRNETGELHCSLKHLLQIYQSNQEVLQKRIREGAPILEQKELAEISKETFAWVKLLWTRLATNKEGENG